MYNCTCTLLKTHGTNASILCYFYKGMTLYDCLNFNAHEVLVHFIVEYMNSTIPFTMISELALRYDISIEYVVEHDADTHHFN